MERVRLVDWLKSERDQHVGGGLYYNSQILFAYNSNHMEGSTLSPEQTAQLFNTDALLPDNINDEIRADDVAETTNHFNAFNWVLDHVDDPVNKSLVCSLHGILKRGTSQEFDANRNVGGYKMIETYAPNRIRYSYVDQWNQAGILRHLNHHPTSHARNRQNQPQYAERYQWAKHATFCPQPQPKRKSTNCRQSS